MADPWLKFYPTDWRADPALKMCSLAARGLWIEMIALMHEASPYGHLVVSGHSPTDTQLAVLAGALPGQVSELLGELESAGVFSRTREGVIYSRKMTRTAKKAAIARKNGKNGGNPTLRKESENPASDNQNTTDRVKPQKPEARSQREKEEADASSKKTSGPSGRGTRLDPGWQPDSDMISFARDAGLAPSQIALEAEKFRDYWLSLAGPKACKRDWAATWRNWVRNTRGASPAASASGVATAQPKDLSDHEWSNAMRRWVDTGEWLADWLCPPPDQPGCTAPPKMLRYAASLLPDRAPEIERNIERSAA
jgi:hypothetical protein